MPRKKNSVIDEERSVYEKESESSCRDKRDKCDKCRSRSRSHEEEDYNPYGDNSEARNENEARYDDESRGHKPYPTRNKNGYMKANWKTSLCGLSLVGFAIVGRVMDFINGGEAIGMGIAGIGLILGKDYDIISRR